MLVLALLAAGCARKEAAIAPAATSLRKVVLQSDWFPQAEHGGFYQALAKGFYREAGLDVEILPGGPGATIKLSVAKGTADFGMYRSDDVIVAASRGLPLVIVGAVMVGATRSRSRLAMAVTMPNNARYDVALPVAPRMPGGLPAGFDPSALQLGRRREAGGPAAHHDHRIALNDRQAPLRRGRRRRARPSG
jgi:hypothetical protein